jgi:Zn-dependent protease with chaperone function
MDCAACGRANPAGTSFCLACGLPLIAVAGAPAGALAAPAALGSPGLPLTPVAPQPAPAVDVEPPPRVASPTEAAPRPFNPTLGPVDRESFFDAQRRNRRATWRLSAACALAAIVTGIPLSLVLTPVFFAVVLLGTRLVSLVVPVPMRVWDSYESIALVLVRAFQQFDDSSTSSTGTAVTHHVSTSAVAFGAVVWLLPGILLMLLIWPALRAVFRSGGVGGLLLTMAARDPRPGDLEERQLVNVVEEIALAAGLPTPRVMLIDAQVANAAVVGSSPHDATIVVARPLLDDLDRDETQGILAHLIGSVGNGDLGVAMSIIAVYQTFGFASALVKAPISPEARATLWRVLRYAFGRRRATRAQDAEDVSRLLRSSTFEVDDEAMKMEADGAVAPRGGFPPGLLWGVLPAAFAWYIFASIKEYPHTTIVWGWTGLGIAAALLIWYQRRYLLWGIRNVLTIGRAMLILPYYLAAMMPQIMLMMLIPFLLEPLIAMTWRTRRFLADATAVQLTRNPDGLANGLVALTERGALLPGGKMAAPLFIVGGEVANTRQMRQMRSLYTPELRRQLSGLKIDENDPVAAKKMVMEALFKGNLTAEQRAAVMAAATAAETSDDNDGGFSGSGSSIVNLHPSLKKRLHRLRQMGAGVAEEEGDPFRAERAAAAAKYGKRRSKLFGFGLLGLIVVPLIILVVVLMLVVLVMLAALSLLFTAILMMLVYGLFYAVLPR